MKAHINSDNKLLHSSGCIPFSDRQKEHRENNDPTPIITAWAKLHKKRHKDLTEEVVELARDAVEEEVTSAPDPPEGSCDGDRHPAVLYLEVEAEILTRRVGPKRGTRYPDFGATSLPAKMWWPKVGQSSSSTSWSSEDRERNERYEVELEALKWKREELDVVIAPTKETTAANARLKEEEFRARMEVMQAEMQRNMAEPVNRMAFIGTTMVHAHQKTQPHKNHLQMPDTFISYTLYFFVTKF